MTNKKTESEVVEEAEVSLQEAAWLKEPKVAGDFNAARIAAIKKAEKTAKAK